MLTKMTDTDWRILVTAFRAARSRRSEKEHDDRKFRPASVSLKCRLPMQPTSEPEWQSVCSPHTQELSKCTSASSVW